MLSLRHRWRVALRIVAALLAAQADEWRLTLPASAWRELTALARHHAAARERQWHVAAADLQTQFETRLRWLETDLRALLLTLRRVPPQPRVRTVYDELVALADEFEEVELQLREATVRVRTAPIVLEGLDLGRFDLTWTWSGDQDLTVSAVEPVRPASRDDLTHPHVLDKRLCVGDAGPALERALADGRLCDYFLIVRQTLETYNRHSAYLTLAEWWERRCLSCDDQVAEDDLTSCEGCHDELCGNCARDCSRCGRTGCSACLRNCSDCLETLCPRCWPRPVGRAASHVCPPCAEADDEESELPDNSEPLDDSQPSEETADDSIASPAPPECAPGTHAPAHAARVGQTALAAGPG